MCLVGNLHKSIEDFKLHQKEILTDQEFLDIRSSTCDSLINDLNSFALATGMVDNNTF